MVTLGGCVDLYGRKDRASKKRKKMSALIAEGVKEHYQVILDHQPHDYDAQEKAGVDLVLGGHTHGGQMFPIGITGELSGANDMTYGMRKRGRTTFIVTSGISDWAIDYKTGGALSEYVVIDITQK
jgi:hypothetical protein